MQTIEMEELLKRWNVEDAEIYPNGIATIDSIRQREGVLRKYLPAGIVRHLNAGLARSKTVHPDTGQALYVICRAMRPQCVFETGTYWGYATSYLAAGVKDNGMGKVHTFDLYERAGKYVPRSLRSYVEFHLGQPSTESMPEVLKRTPPQLFFQDSLHDYKGVSSELRIILPYLAPDALILFHDFVLPEVQRAATDTLQNYTVCLLQSQDPQQLGVAFQDAIGV